MSEISDTARQAAALVKATAENTAMALNIQYIQRDLVEIKQAIKEISAKDETYVLKKDQEPVNTDRETRLRFLEKYVWIGITLVGVVEPILIAIFINFITNK